MRKNPKKIRKMLMKRGKRLSRYSHFNLALKQAKVFNKIEDNTERYRQIDRALVHLLRYSPERCLNVTRLWLTVGQLDISPMRIKLFDKLHDHIGKITLTSNTTSYLGKMNQLLRRKKLPYRQRVECYRYEGATNFTVSAETYNTIKQGVQEALSRLQFDPIRDFEENTIGLMDAMWKINQLTKKDE